MDRHEKHVNILGWIYIVHGALLLIIAAFVFVVISGAGFFEGLSEGDLSTMAFAPLIGGFVGVFLALLAVPSFFAGTGLLNRRPWARILTLVLGFFKFFDFPIGTAIGIYSYWVLLQTDADYIFRDRFGYRNDYSTY